jgi:hypothetical protein
VMNLIAPKNPWILILFLKMRMEELYILTMSQIRSFITFLLITVN